MDRRETLIDISNTVLTKSRFHGLVQLLSGIHHIAINVRDIEKSLKFYRETLGLELLFPPEEGSGEELEKAAKVSGAKLKFAMLQAGNTCVELIQYVNPVGRPYDRRNCDTGNMHLAFRVPNAVQAYEELKKRGVRFNSPPVGITSGSLNGKSFAYFTDPDGVTLEIFQE